VCRIYYNKYSGLLKYIKNENAFMYYIILNFFYKDGFDNQSDLVYLRFWNNKKKNNFSSK